MWSVEEQIDAAKKALKEAGQAKDLIQQLHYKLARQRFESPTVAEGDELGAAIEAIESGWGSLIAAIDSINKGISELENRGLTNGDNS